MNELVPAWSNQTKLIVTLSILVLVVYLLFRFSIILTPFILSVILAYILSPAASFFQARLRINRLAATALVYLILLAVLTTLPLGIIPALSSQIAGLNVDFQRILERAEMLLARQYIIFGQVIDGQAVFRQAMTALQGLLEPVFGQTVDLVVEVISSIVKVIFIAVVSFYLIKDGPALHSWLEKLILPAHRRTYVGLRDEIGKIWSAFFRGQLILALVVSIIFTVFGFALGLPFALAMGLFAGLLEFLPSLGHGIWLVTASLLAVFAGSSWIPIPNWAFMLLIIGLHLFYQQFDLNYLIPRIIGHSVHLPPLVIILGIVTGGVLAGVLGIFLAAPTIASLRVLGRYIYANLFDLEPFVETLTPSLPPPDSRWWRRKRVKDQVLRGKGS